MAQQEPKPCAQLPRMRPPRALHSDPLIHTPWVRVYQESRHCLPFPYSGCSHLGVADRALVVREVGHLEHIEHLAPAPRAVVRPQAVPCPQHQHHHHHHHQQKHGLGVGSGVVFVQIIRKKSQMSQNCSNWHKKRCPVSPLPRCGAEWWCHISCCMRGRHVSDVRPCPEQRVHYSEETTIINKHAPILCQDKWHVACL